MNLNYVEVTTATEQYIRQLLSVELEITPSEIKMRHEIAKGAFNVWSNLAAPLVEVETHISEQDRLGELVHELASSIRVTVAKR